VDTERPRHNPRRVRCHPTVSQSNSLTEKTQRTPVTPITTNRGIFSLSDNCDVKAKERDPPEYVCGRAAGVVRGRPGIAALRLHRGSATCPQADTEYPRLERPISSPADARRTRTAAEPSRGARTGRRANRGRAMPVRQLAAGGAGRRVAHRAERPASRPARAGLWFGLSPRPRAAALALGGPLPRAAAPALGYVL